jgi:proteasome lid subunit RPN8/RPN11
MLRYSTAIQERLWEHAARAYPYEGCGLLLGQAIDGANDVRALYPVENRWPDPEERRVRFRIATEDMLTAELAAAGQDLEVIGVFHSHPDHPAVASPRDLAWAGWNGYSYLITEVRGGRPSISRSWQLMADRSGFVEEAIEVS